MKRSSVYLIEIKDPDWRLIGQIPSHSLMGAEQIAKITKSMLKKPVRIAVYIRSWELEEIQ